MGAGAGYTIYTKDISITNLDEGSIKITELNQWNNGLVHGLTAEVDCSIEAVGDVRAESYYYGCDWIKDVPFTITHVSININIGMGFNKEILTQDAIDQFTSYYGVDDVEELYDELKSLSVSQINRSYVVDCIKDGYFDGDGLVGGGWTHSTFDGEVTLSLNDHDGYNELYDATIRITDKEVVEFIDLAVTGDNTEFTAWYNGEPLDTYGTVEEAKEALKSEIDQAMADGNADDIDFSDCYVEGRYWKLLNAAGEVESRDVDDFVEYTADGDSDYDDYI